MIFNINEPKKLNEINMLITIAILVMAGIFILVYNNLYLSSFFTIESQVHSGLLDFFLYVFIFIGAILVIKMLKPVTRTEEIRILNDYNPVVRTYVEKVKKLDRGFFKYEYEFLVKERNKP